MYIYIYVVDLGLFVHGQVYLIWVTFRVQFCANIRRRCNV